MRSTFVTVCVMPSLSTMDCVHWDPDRSCTERTKRATPKNASATNAPAGSREEITEGLDAISIHRGLLPRSC